MRKLFITAGLVCLAGCSANQPETQTSMNTAKEESATFEKDKIQVSVRLLEVQGTLSRQQALDSLESSLPSLHKLVAAQGSSLTGKFALGFRTEPNGMIRMALENESTLSGEKSKSLVSAFIGTAMSKQWEFVQSSGASLVQADFTLGS